MKSLLELQNLHVNFRSYLGVAEVLNGIDIEVKEGEWFGLAGESGCGKSVTAYSILRLLPESADVTNGKIFFQGSDLLEKTEKQMRRVRGNDIGIVFQDPQTALDPSMRILPQLVEGLRSRKRMRQTEAVESAVNILQKVRIQRAREWMGRYPHELSGGMKQRVCIAAALLANPKLLIADEFTTNLDVTTQSEIISLVSDLKKEFNTSVLFITHDLSLISECCDRVAIMYAGQIVERGRQELLFRKPLHPYTRSLLKCVPSIRGKISRLESIDGFVPSLIDPPKGCRFHTRCKQKIPEVCNKWKPAACEVEEGHTVHCHLYLKEKESST